MQQLLGNLWRQFVEAGAPARWALGVIVTAALAVGGFSLYQSKNPHFEVLVSGLDDSGFSRAVSALANAGIRHQTTNPPGPFTVFVESARLYDARNAMHAEGNFTGPLRGIDAEVTGSSAMFLGQRERDQRSEKRDWQETELQLENINWVSRANVKVFGGVTSALMGQRRDDRTVAVTLTLRGGAPPDTSQRRTLANIVASSTGVPLAKVKVSDQNGNMLFDGGEAQNADSLFAIESSWRTDLERSLQAKLDSVFGPGLSIVGVSGTWSHIRQESVEETLEPAKKPRTERTLKVADTSTASLGGGPAGAIANISEGASTSSERAAVTGNTTDEAEKTNVFGSRTTHQIAQPHILQRMSISLVLDESIAANLPQAEKLVKGWASFDLKREDSFEGAALALHSVQRDAEGKPIPEVQELAPAAPNPLIGKLLEHGIEIAAAVAFLIVLLRSLKGAKQAARGQRPGSGRAIIDPETGTATIKLGTDGKPLLSDLLGDEEIDLDLLARKHVEELLEKDPEKVSALLSRWALGEQFYAGSESR